jgi:hypothetical protein
MSLEHGDLVRATASSDGLPTELGAASHVLRVLTHLNESWFGPHSASIGDALCDAARRVTLGERTLSVDSPQRVTVELRRFARLGCRST